VQDRAALVVTIRPETRVITAAHRLAPPHNRRLDPRYDTTHPAKRRAVPARTGDPIPVDGPAGGEPTVRSPGATDDLLTGADAETDFRSPGVAYAH
jgi:hypothetical protein